MTWKSFAYSIKKSELMDGTPARIVIALFENAGYICTRQGGLTEVAVKKWFVDDKRCHGYTFFPNGKLENSQGAYKFFRNRPADKQKKLQEIFREVKDNDSPIDCETEDMDRFCWSLVNQFLDKLGFQRLDMPLENNADNIENNIDSNADQSLITLPKENTHYLDKNEFKPLTVLSTRNMLNFLMEKSYDIEDTKKRLKMIYFSCCQ